jgi:hypothetical protein
MSVSVHPDEPTMGLDRLAWEVMEGQHSVAARRDTSLRTV